MTEEEIKAARRNMGRVNVALSTLEDMTFPDGPDAEYLRILTSLRRWVAEHQAQLDAGKPWA